MTRGHCLAASLLVVVLSACLGSLSALARSNDGKIVIGFPTPGLTSVWWVTAAKYAEMTGQELGITVLVTDAQDNDAKQIADVENLIARGVDGLVISPRVGALAPRMLAMARSAGIPVIFIDRAPAARQEDWPGTYIAFIEPDSVDAGYRVAKYLIEQAGVKKLVAIEGLPGTESSRDRVEGLKLALREHPDVQLLASQPGDWVQDKGQRVMEDFLAAYPDLDGVWAANDPMAMGALRAIENAGRRGRVYIGGIDMNEDAVQAIADGDKGYVVSVGGHWIVGAFGVAMMYDYLNGIEPAAEERHVKFRMNMVTKENADDYLRVVFAPDFLVGKLRMLSKVVNPSARTAPYDEIFDVGRLTQ